MYLSQSISDRISKEEFLAAYNQFPPNGWIKFTFRYFSNSTVKKDKWLKIIFAGIALSLFIIGFIGTLVNWKHTTVGLFVCIFGAMIVAIAMLMSATAIMNNLRIRKIRKVLGITKQEYESLVSVYMP